MNNFNILVPVYNDWKSFNKLISKIDQNLKNLKGKLSITVINDKSTKKPQVKLRKTKKIKQITILNLKENIGSQKSIAVGLDYLKKKGKNFYLIVMDGDGEDAPKDIKKLIKESTKYKDHIVTSNRKEREESFMIKICYKIHLLITLIFTYNWISFGNFSCMNSKNIKKILLNNNVWYAYSSGILKNCNIKRIYAKREKRYFEKSKTRFLSLLEHSFRIMAVFYSRVLVTSLIYILLSVFFLGKLKVVILLPILILNTLVIWSRIKHYKKNLINYREFLASIKKFNFY